MRRPFEELIGSDLDRLYRAALFLAGGREERAERVLTTTVLDAFGEYTSLTEEPNQAGPWLLDRLARTLLDAEDTPEPGGSMGNAPGSSTDESGSGATGRQPVLPSRFRLEDVAEAAVQLPLRHRIAFWFAVVERRRYGEIAEALAEPRSTVAARIREAHRVIVAGLARSGDERRGNTGTST